MLSEDFKRKMIKLSGVNLDAENVKLIKENKKPEHPLFLRKE